MCQVSGITEEQATAFLKADVINLTKLIKEILADPAQLPIDTKYIDLVNTCRYRDSIVRALEYYMCSNDYRHFLSENGVELI